MTLIDPSPPTFFAVRVRPSHHLRSSRSSSSSGSEGWVEVVENGISYSFDITRVMFCSGKPILSYINLPYPNANPPYAKLS